MPDTWSDAPILGTQRLRLRVPTEDDVDFVLDMYSRTDVTRHLGTTDWLETTAEQALRRVAGYRRHFSRSHGVWVAETRQAANPVGFGLLKPIPFSAGVEAAHQDVEIGWHLHPDAWGLGYATETAEALVTHARRAGLTEIVAVTSSQNLASQAVAQRLGMSHQGSTDRYYDTVCELFTLTLEPHHLLRGA